MSDIGERVKKIVVEHLGVRRSDPNRELHRDLSADNLDTVELVSFEEEFGCEIPDDAAETILTVGDAVKFLEKNAKSDPKASTAGVRAAPGAPRGANPDCDLNTRWQRCVRVCGACCCGETGSMVAL
jgi:acyl carrier protein